MGIANIMQCKTTIDDDDDGKKSFYVDEREKPLGNHEKSRVKAFSVKDAFFNAKQQTSLKSAAFVLTSKITTRVHQANESYRESSIRVK